MIGLTIGIGGLWPEIAARSARRMEKMTGIKCYAFKATTAGINHPSWLKCKLMDFYPKVGDFLVFDADIFSMQVWSPQTIFQEMKGAFCAVPDRNHKIVLDECQEHNLPFPDWYINGGLMMFSRAHKPLWDAVFAKHPKYGRWLEQTALNKSIQELGVEVCRLPRVFNTLPNLDATGSWYDLDAMRKSGVVNFHMADLGGDGTKILELQKELGME
jgi:hypothetical protein